MTLLNYLLTIFIKCVVKLILIETHPLNINDRNEQIMNLSDLLFSAKIRFRG